MANKIVAVFLMFAVVLAAVQVREAVAHDEFKACFYGCHNDCKGEGKGNTFCEMKCDTDCTVKEAVAKLHAKWP